MNKGQFWLTATSATDEHVLTKIEHEIEPAGEITSMAALGLHILMGRNTPDYVQNMIANVSTGRIAPVELVARKP